MLLFRAVSRAELEDLRTHNGSFRDSSHLTGEKGFFFSKDDALRMAHSFEMMEGEPHSVVATKMPDELLPHLRAHNAAQEGPGVYLLEGDWKQLSPAEEVEL
jgi:hypothetical protein